MGKFSQKYGFHAPLKRVRRSGVAGPADCVLEFAEWFPPLERVFRASLVAQWLRIRLPMQGTRVRALVREDPTCRRATKLVRHNY